MDGISRPRSGFSGFAMNKHLAAALVLAASTTGALAADLGSPRTPIAAAVVMPANSWTGLYVGGHLGYGFGWRVPSPLGFAQSLGGNGVFGGLQIGYDWQFDRIVAGLAVDGSIANIGRRTNFGGGLEEETRLRSMATFRGRLGFLATPDLLLYATGGLAVGQRRYDLLDLSGNNQFGGSFGASRTMLGWTAGVGAEYRVATNWSVFAEYRYVDLGSKPISPVVNNNVAMAVRTHAALVGFNYRFSTGPSAVVARY
jgi:outer membrane immunogenic protein